jgi:hypothetical protein
MFIAVKRIMFRITMVQVVGGAALLLLMGLWFANPIVPYFRAKFGPPTPVTLASLNRGNFALPIYFAEIEGDNTYDSGYVFQERERLIFFSENFYGLLQLSDKLLLIYTDDVPNVSRTTWVGTLDNDLSRQERDMISEIEQENPSIAGAILPYKLNVIDPDYFAWWLSAGAAAVFAALAAFVFRNGIRASFDPTSNYVWQELQRYGEDVEATVADIERDMQDSGLGLGIVRFSDKWLVYQAGMAFRAMRIEDIVWMYPNSRSVRIRGVSQEVPYSAVFLDTYGKRFEAVLGELNTDPVLAHVASRVPWAENANTRQHRTAWKRQRGQFLDRVASRKREHQLNQQE